MGMINNKKTSIIEDIKFGFFGKMPKQKATTELQEHIVKDDAEKAIKTLDSALATRSQKQEALAYLDYARQRGVKI